MAHLAIVGSFAVNGVAAIHSEIIKHTIFEDFFEIWPEKFQNKTNGVTPRRWLAFCNPDLAQLITEALNSDEWKTNMSKLEGLRDKAEDGEFQKKWKAVKQKNKERLAAKIKEITGDTVDINAMFDIQVASVQLRFRFACSFLDTDQEDPRVQETTLECDEHHLEVHAAEGDDAG